MEPWYEPLDTIFSTADAQYPQLVAEDGIQRVTYRDWQERLLVLVFQAICLSCHRLSFRLHFP